MIRLLLLLLLLPVWSPAEGHTAAESRVNLSLPFSRLSLISSCCKKPAVVIEPESIYEGLGMIIIIIINHVSPSSSIMAYLDTWSQLESVSRSGLTWPCLF